LLFFVLNQQDIFMQDFGSINPALSMAQRVHTAIASAAQDTGVDFGYLLGQARIESSLNPRAKASTSTASGLFQFTKQTWFATIKQHGSEHGLGWAADHIASDAQGKFHITDPSMREAILNLRDQPEAASTMAAEFASDNAELLEQNLGRAAEPVDLYLAHFLGAGGAVQFLKAHDANPDGGAALILPKAAAANQQIFYRDDGSMHSFAEIRRSFADKLGITAPSPVFLKTRMTSDTVPSIATQKIRQEFPGLRPMVAMPHRLSLEFARSSYQRLAALNGDV
jgi:Transglycosylase SLT domain